MFEIPLVYFYSSYINFGPCTCKKNHQLIFSRVYNMKSNNVKHDDKMEIEKNT